MVQVLRIRYVFSILGVLLILGSLGMELIPGTQAGIGPLQIIGIVVGGGILILSRIKLSLGFGLLISIVSLIVTIVLFELVLSLLGFEPKTVPVAVDRVQFRRDWICDDEIGCRWDQKEVQRNCLTDKAKQSDASRLCQVNSQGYFDEQEFVASADLDSADYKILVLGDSFTWGSSADLGRSWVEILESGLNQSEDVLVWNTGIPATGTRQALAITKHFMPIMKPDLVLLGFYGGNDFEDNLYPVDNGARVKIDDSNAFEFALTYELDQNLEPVKLSQQEIIYRTLDSYWPKTQLERLLASTRVGTLLLGAIASLSKSTDKTQKAFSETERLLEDLQNYVAANKAKLIVLIIPSKEDMDTPTPSYQAAVDIMQRLEIPFVDPLQLLEIEDYINLSPTNRHWNNEGHRKAGELILDCVSFLIDHSGMMCPQIMTKSSD